MLVSALPPAGADHEATRQDTYRRRRCVGVLGLVGGLVAAGLAAGPVRITVDGADMTVHFSLPDKVLAVHGDVRVPLAGIRKISVVNQPCAFLRGWYDRGARIPNMLA